MAAIINPQVFNELQATLGADFIGELVDTYCEETPELLEQLQQALSQNDAEAFRRAAHSIKSSSASLGALEFSAQAKDLELLGKSGDISGAGEKVARLRVDYAQVEQALHVLVLHA